MCYFLFLAFRNPQWLSPFDPLSNWITPAPPVQLSRFLYFVQRCQKHALLYPLQYNESIHMLNADTFWLSLIEINSMSSSIFDILLKHNIRFVNIYISYRNKRSRFFFLYIHSYSQHHKQQLTIAIRLRPSRILRKGRLFFLTQYTKK